MARWFFVMVFSMLCLTCCCGTSATASAPCEAIRAPLEVVTFNAGLAPGIVPYATPRAPSVVHTLQTTDWDIMCLQEIWKDEDRDAIVNALHLTPEHVLFADTRGKNEFPNTRCDALQVIPIVSCILAHCGADSTDERAAVCALDQCKRELLLMYLAGGKSCLNCLLATAGESLDRSSATCLGSGASRLYGGRNGVILMSKTPLRNTAVIDIPSSGANRVGLFATVDVPGLSAPLNVACTHLSSPAQIPPTQTGYADWESEQRAQLEAISTVLLARAAGGPAILVGDLNTGDGSHGLTGTSPSVWDDARRLGYRDAMATAGASFCTECGENTLAPTPNEDATIDHVLVAPDLGSGQEKLTPTCAQRLFTDKVVIRGYNGEPVRTNLSDHYGFKAKFNVR